MPRCWTIFKNIRNHIQRVGLERLYREKEAFSGCCSIFDGDMVERIMELVAL